MCVGQMIGFRSETRNRGRATTETLFMAAAEPGATTKDRVP
ncbi:hypothetical protein MBUL_02843 [Methylobacterium bullatum]|uniref:Uncharacterized protein n=1 Tax=Methylobacterium bullatum TaxID=570505 RepID=A0A679J867_9HYPH|nr:hypothetical protein MBUL_02843 [Methylobacterium bullatum]